MAPVIPRIVRAQFPRGRGFAGRYLHHLTSDIGYPEKTNSFFSLLQQHNLDWICGLYTGWADYEFGAWSAESVDAHVGKFKAQLDAIHTLPVLPVHINSHTGSDHFSESESIDCFNQVLQIPSRISISHETHRGRILHSPWTTLRLIRQFPQLRLTLDLSHWNVVSERLLTLEILNPVLERVDHIHARVGTHEAPQVGHPRDPFFQNFTEYHESVWKRVWHHQKATDKHVSTLTPEYGPASDFYMPYCIHVDAQNGKRERRPEVDLKELVFSESNVLHSQFATWLSKS